MRFGCRFLGGCLACGLLLGVFAMGAWAEGFEEVRFETSDGGTIYGNLYGEGDEAVVLAHGAVFDKESWHELAMRLAEEGVQVLAIDFRGYGKSEGGSEGRGGMALDVLGAVAYLREGGVREVSVVGGSMGGSAAAAAAVKAGPEDIDRLVLLAAGSVAAPEQLQAATLFIVSEGEGMREGVEADYAVAAEPKKLVVLAGNEHAQHVFKTDQAGALTEAIVSWVTGDAGTGE
ncbi:MAG: alpha/beta fold hydrolase [Verrucomicrobiota bacterium]